MRSLGLASLCLSLCLASSPLAAAETIVLPTVILDPEEQADVPAQESGALKEVLVRNGQQVTQGEVLAQIDDLIPRAQFNVAKFKLAVAARQALDDVDVRYSEAAYKHAAAKLERALKANEKIPNTVTDDEVDEKRLDKRKFELAIEKAKKDMDVAGMQKGVSEAELAAADANLQHRAVVSPVDGVVVDLLRHQGEWVQAGETILRVIRMDVLRADGNLAAAEYNPADVQGRPVTVTMTLPHGQKETFPGKIVYVKPVVESGLYLVRAEVQNRQRNGFWVLCPGMFAEMTIQLK